MSLLAELDAGAHRLPLDAARDGDILVFWIRDPERPCHLGIKTPTGLLHTHAGAGGVVEHCLDDFWRRRVAAAYAFPGVDD